MVALSLGFSAVALNAGPTPAATSQPDQVSAIAAMVQKAMKTEHLRAVIVEVTQDDKAITSQAFGESITGVPATTAMHFPNGAVAFAYVSTLLMEFVDEHKIKLDDTIDRWMPTLPEANNVTLKMLANQTSGYPDFETDPAWLAAWSAKSVPHLDVRRAAQVRLRPLRAIRSGNKLELRAHQLHDSRRDPG